MSGPLSVPLAAVAVYASDVWVKAGFGVLAFVSLCVAAFGVWTRERNARAIAEAELARFSGLEISFGGGRSLAWDKDGPLRQVINVFVHNRTGSRLDDCRLQLRIITHDGVSRPEWARFTVCEPFSLLVDETSFKPILEYNFDELNPPLIVPLFDEIDHKWVKREGNLVVLPGNHEITVEGISSGARMVRLPLEAKFVSDRWEIAASQK
jgi:hypothetical protein